MKPFKFIITEALRQTVDVELAQRAGVIQVRQTGPPMTVGAGTAGGRQMSG
jgi:hypothetical protein